MSCCGSQRQFLGSAQVPDRRRQPLPQAAIRFEYVGSTGLTTVGPVTGRRYRFDKPGSRVLVDPRDAPSLAAVPFLRRI